LSKHTAIVGVLKNKNKSGEEMETVSCRVVPYKGSQKPDVESDPFYSGNMQIPCGMSMFMGGGMGNMSLNQNFSIPTFGSSAPSAPPSNFDLFSFAPPAPPPQY